ncbi:MAG: glutamate synthase subunit alpha, partial [Chloroflexota bacterium]
MTKDMVPWGLYRPEFEHDACGVGIVADILGRNSHRMVELGLEVLDSLAHRGACGCDPNTGDGGGMLLQMPHAFFARHNDDIGVTLPGPGDYGVGMVYLPRTPAERARCQQTVEDVVRAEGQRLLGWRDVPVDDKDIGYIARDSQPIIRQVFVARGPNTPDQAAFERKLYVIRKRIENEANRSGIRELGAFYIPSFSSQKLVYKGLLMGNQLRGYYPDLLDPTTESSFVMVHSRFSTNTL